MKLKLTNIFSIVYFVPLFIVLGLFSYWQYLTMVEFQKIEQNNFFDQTNKIIDILIQKEKSEIKDIVLSNINQIKHDNKTKFFDINHLDFVFSTKNNIVTNISGYSLIVDVKSLANKLKKMKSLDNIIKINLNKKLYYVIAHKEEIIDDNFGKVIGELWGVTILNENVVLLKEFKENANIEDIVIIDDYGEIVASTIKDSIIKQKLKNKNLKYIFGEKYLIKNDKFYLKSLFIINSSKYTSIFDLFILKTGTVILILIFFGLLLYFLIRIKFINKLLELRHFIEATLKNEDKAYESSNIVELDKIAYEFTVLFLEFQEYQNNLEVLVDEKTKENSKQMKLLQEQSKLASMGEMIGNIAHQWRQPLNELTIRIQNLKYQFKSGEIDESFIKTFIKENKQTIEFMSNTIDDFRTFYSVNKKKQSFLVKESILSIVSIQSAQINSLNISLEVKGNEFEYVGFQSEFQQVILNLINNAKDALIDNKIINPYIKILIDDEKKIIYVQDNAGGIPLDILDRLFEPYFTTKEQGSGTGLGLYMSKMIIEDSMNGKLNVTNTKEGASFTIDFNKEDNNEHQ